MGLNQIRGKENKGAVETNRVARIPLFTISSISSLDGGSAAVGTEFAIPFGTQEIAAIILDSNTYKQNKGNEIQTSSSEDTN